MNKEKWYHKSYRRNLIDMHIPDWNDDFFSEIDTDQYVEQLKKANVDTAYIYATSCVGLCNFPTKIGRMHAGLKGRDIIREITDKCRDAGIRPMIYMNTWSKWAYDNYPDWRCISPDRRQSGEYMFGQPGRYGVLCLNSPYKDYWLGLLTELIENYQVDGLWVDMIKWHMVCTCPHCKARFKAETGYDLPETVDMTNPVFLSFIHKREEWLSEFFDEIRNKVYSYNPDATVVCNSSYHPAMFTGISLDFARQTEYITGDAELGPVRSFEAKLFNNITKNHPFEFLCSVMDPNLDEHSMLKTEEHLLQLMTSCMAHNGRNGFIDAIDPSGNLNPTVYETMRKVYDQTDKYIPFLENKMEMCADVAIYTNFSCYYEPEENGKPLFDKYNSTHLISAKKMAERLVEHNIPYDVITPLQLDILNKFKVVLLPDVFVLSKKEVEAFSEYVKNGGKIYASGRCGVYDGFGGENKQGALSNVLGVKLMGITDEEKTFIRPLEKWEHLPNYSKMHPLSCKLKQCLVQTDADTNVFGLLTLPIVPSKDITKFASAISDPPGIHTEYPSLTEHTFGKGKAVYSAATIENLSGRDHSNMFAHIVKDLMGDAPVFKSDAPYPAEIVMYRQKESGRYIINITNSTLPVLTLPDITVKIKAKNVKALYHAPDKKEVSYTREGEYISFKIDRLRVYEMFILEVAC